MPVQATARLRDADRTRAELLDVATRQFAEHGFSGARVDDIAAETRTTKRMIYYCFGGKEQLYAIRRLAEVTFDHHAAHPDFVRLASIEDIHRAEHIVKSSVLAQLTTTAIDVHLLISMFCMFRIANRYTFGAIIGRDPADPLRRDHYRAMLGDLVVAYLTTPLLHARDAE